MPKVSQSNRNLVLFKFCTLVQNAPRASVENLTVTILCCKHCLHWCRKHQEKHKNSVFKKFITCCGLKLTKRWGAKQHSKNNKKYFDSELEKIVNYCGLKLTSRWGAKQYSSESESEKCGKFAFRKDSQAVDSNSSLDGARNSF